MNPDRFDYRLLHEQFVQQANLTPDNLAVIEDNGLRLTFRELNEKTDIVATYLRCHGVGPDKVVGIFMRKCIDYVISYIAILKAGGAYLPVDVAYPASMLESIFNDCQPTAVIAEEKYCHLVAEGDSGARKVIKTGNNWVEELKAASAHLSVLDTGVPDLDSLAYAVYSSGTTGKPKGILCPHRGAVLSYQYRYATFPYQPVDRDACNIFFVWEMLRPLLRGIPMFIIPDEVIYDTTLLCDFIDRHNITRILFTPSLLEAIVDTANQQRAHQLRTLRCVWLCGEVVTVALLERCMQLLPSATFINLYSISECHDVGEINLNEWYNANMNHLTAGGVCPAGRVFAGLHVFILDERMQMRALPLGIAGEIYVGGATLARGYLNRPDLNAARFVARPATIDSSVGSRLYRTGDWGSIGADGLIEVAGRCDSLVKVRGYSIELQAVETALLELSGLVNACVVIAHGNVGEDKSVVAYVVPNGNASVRDIRLALKKRLPFYMIPSHIVFLNRHSLLAVRLVNKLNDEFGVALRVADLMAHSTLREMAHLVDGAQPPPAAVDLIGDVELYSHRFSGSATELRSLWRRLETSGRQSHILLTGATGFVGSVLLRELLRGTDAQLYCLVRPAPQSAARDRLAQALRKICPPADSHSPLHAHFDRQFQRRVHCVAGDIELLNLGLSADDFAFLSTEIDVIVHTAAYVNLILPYSALRRANVIGVSNVLQFATAGKLKALHHISSSAIAPPAGAPLAEAADTAPLGRSLADGYGQSKWTAEQLVVRARALGLPAAVYRLGNMAADCESGVWNFNDHVLNLIGSCLRVGCYPVNWQMEMTPVDFAARLITKLTELPSVAFGSNFHIVSPHPLHASLLFSWFTKNGCPCSPVSFSDWTLRVRSRDDCAQTVRLLDTLIRDESFFTQHAQFDNANVMSALAANDMSYPNWTEHLFEQVFPAGWLDDYRQLQLPASLSDVNKPLLGRVALVTGASSGIGEAVAKQLATAGCTVAMAARRIGRLQQLSNQLHDAGAKATAIRCDVTIKDDVYRMVNLIERQFGPVDILINNAGLMLYTLMRNMRLDDWERQIDINVKGAVNCIGAVLPSMTRRHQGHIVQMSSDAGRRGFAGLAVYSGTKFFIEGLSQALRHELVENGVRVTCIQPGDVRTELQSHSTDTEAQQLYDQSGSNRILDVENIASAVLFAVCQPSHCAVNEILIEPTTAPV